MTTIPQRMAVGCSKLSKVTLGSQTINIGDSAFVNCGSLARADIPEQTVSVGFMAFAGCADDFTIYGTYGSAAEGWALDNECLFIDEQAEGITGVTVVSNQDTLRIGERNDISATVEPDSAASHANIQWFVKNPEILRIQDGKLIGLKRGTTTVTAMAQNGTVGTKEFTVIGLPAERIVIQPVERYWAVGSTVELTSEISPMTAEDEKPQWSSMTPETASIDEEGAVIFLNEGEAVLRATTISGRWDEMTLEVYTPVEVLTVFGVEGNETALTLYLPEGMNQVLCSPVIEPMNATHQTLTWTSSNPQIAAVDENGNVTALRAGEADITASTAWTIDREPVIFVWHVTAAPYSLENAQAEQITEPFAVYDGNAHVPNPMVLLNDVELISGQDYEVSCDNAVNAGTHICTITGIGEYTGSIELPFLIEKGLPTLTYIGDTVFELAHVAFPYCSVDFPVDISTRWRDDESSAYLDSPNHAGSWHLVFTAQETENCRENQLEIAVQVVDSFALGRFISTEALTMWVGQSLRVVYHPLLNNLLPKNYEDGLRLLWTSSDPAVVVDDTGMISAYEEGDATVRIGCFRDGFIEPLSAEIAVHVVSPENINICKLPSALKTLESEALADMGAVNCIELGGDVSRIDGRAFADNSQLWQIKISNEEVTIAQDALENTAAVLVLEREPKERDFALPYVLQ